MSIRGYAAMAAKDNLVQFRYEPENLGPWDIEIAITHCGICHSDIHLIDNDWHTSIYPLVPGHEIVGTVTAVGSAVSRILVGQRVGVGWQRSACMECEWCLRGEENMCSQNQATCVGHYGGFATAIRTDSRFAFPIPESLSSENAAPLLCGGITVYSPLRLYGVKPQMRAGVIGIGGLGHMALQFLRAFGCEVTAFSTSPEKEQEAKNLGAHHFVVPRDRSVLEKLGESFDFIISTVFADLDWIAYVNLLRPNGKFCFVGAAPQPVSLPLMALMFRNRSVCGSIIGNRTGIAEMLEFSARHNIRAMTECLPLDSANEAIRKVRQNRARYRMVLAN